jgi:lysophospholipase L1-like esterase
VAPKQPQARQYPARFRVAAESRHPRLTDYNSAAHAYADAYVRPAFYGITVEDFPGMTLVSPREDQQRNPRPGQRNSDPEDIFRLNGPSRLTGWRFTLSGRPDSAPRLGPRRPTLKQSGWRTILSTRGTFHPERTDNAWNWHFAVPGPGVYVVTVERMDGTTVIGTRTQRIVLRDFLVVSLGDSAASGQGNPDIPGRPAGFDPDIHWYDVLIPGALTYKLSKAAYKWARDQILQDKLQLARGGGYRINMDPLPVWLEPLAQRSLRSSHAFAAKTCEDTTKGTLVTFLGFGRTGAEIDDGLIGPRTDKGRSTDGWANDRGEIAEVVAVLARRRIDALILQIGINDIRVSGTLSQLVAGDFPIGTDSNPTAARQQAEAAAQANLALLPAAFKRLATALSVLNVGQIYLVEYPTSLFDDANGVPQHGCEVFNGPDLDLSKRDAELVKSIAHDLNTALATAADAYGWIFVTGVEANFQGHGYCRPGGERWFRTCSESLVMQGDTEGTIHPNSTGHIVIGRQIAARIKKYTITVGQQTQTDAGPPTRALARASTGGRR